MTLRWWTVSGSVACAVASLVGCSGDDGAPAGVADGGGVASDAGVDAPSSTSDASSTQDAAPGADASREGAVDASVDSGHSGWVASIVGVGYGGLRVVSRDNGVTWKNRAELAMSGGDDNNLLRGIAYGNGIWVTVGWRVFKSMDGAITWNEQTPPQGCGLMEGVSFGAGHFIGTCGTDAFASSDGTTWTRVAMVGDTGGHTYVFFVNGLFYSSGDSKKSYSSPDGHTWSELVGTQAVAFCDGRLQTRAACPGFWNGGIYLSTQWESKITRSTDAVHFATVFDDPGNNAPYTEYSFALGESPP